MSDQKKSGCLPLVLFVLLCGSMLVNVVLFMAQLATFWETKAKSAFSEANSTGRFSEVSVESAKNDSADKVAVIPLKGLISSGVEGRLTHSVVDDTKIALRQAATDPNVRAIVFLVDSPGGEVTASDVIYNEVRAARERKPVVVYLDSIAASGGFYAACGGSYIMAHETTLTGSIGVIIQTLKYKDLFGKIGLESVVFKSGQFKDILSGTRDMTDLEKKFVQDMVMQTYDKFVGIVAAERKISESHLRQNIADGRILSGKDAATQKLINTTGYIEDAYAKARELGQAPNAAVVRYEAQFKFTDFFRAFGETGSAQQKRVEIELPGALLPRLESGRIYLLPAFYAE
ncbi:MAG TPA: signal peptide peptidase SppA [Chthoniobacterales bacterium]